MNLGKLNKVGLREAWPHEANDFTRWMAEEENLRLLSDELGFDISLIQTEAAVGGFNVDILAQEAGTDRKVIIENQLEITNHDHLGKLITYAAGHDAGAIIWVVKDAREEHRKAIDWLNEHTDEEVSFYLIRIELWQIGDSPFAPKFEIVCKPNDWAKVMKASGDQGELTDTGLKQLQFWNDLKAYAKESAPQFRFPKASAKHWSNLSIGCSGANLALTILRKERVMGVELYIPDNQELFEHLLQDQADIEKDLGVIEPIEWMPLPKKKASRIKVSKSADFTDDSHRAEHFEWLLSMASKFRKTFERRLRNYRTACESEVV